jgi:hypothetical protein
MVEEIASQAVKLAGQALGLPALLLVILALAVFLVLLKRAGGITLPTPPEDTPGSPPIIVNPDGSIPVSNEQGPPDPSRG